MRNNNIHNNTYNFDIVGSDISHFYHDIDTTNTINGKPIYYLVEQSNLVFDDSMSIGYLCLVTCKNINVKNLIFTNERNGLLLVNTSYSTIKNLTLYNNIQDGISLYYSLNNNITNCHIYNNTIGISLYDSSDKNTIIDNNIISNCNCGIFLHGSIYNNIIGNNISNNSWDGLTLKSSSDNNIIIGNNISLNINNGIFLWDSSGNNIITGNNISKNDRGINIYGDCDNNTVYHNNFIGNTENAFDYGDNTWDDGKYGNFWSDYKERYPDSKKKPFKGIWDTPYEIDGGDNNDSYPLINQWPKSRPRNTSRTQTTVRPIFYWFLEHFPLLEKLLNLIYYN